MLADARRLGYAEADPSADIDGDDAAAKLVVLAGIAFRRHLRLTDIPRRSIRPISAADFRYAQPSRLHDSPDLDGRRSAGTAFTLVSGRRWFRAGRASAAMRAPTTSSRSTEVRRREQLQRRRRRRAGDGGGGGL